MCFSLFTKERPSMVYVECRICNPIKRWVLLLLLLLLLLLIIIIIIIIIYFFNFDVLYTIVILNLWSRELSLYIVNEALAETRRKV